MATLAATTVNGTITATTSFTSPTLLTAANNQRFREYVSAPNVAIAKNGGYIYLLGNTGVHERMYGTLRWWVNHGYFQAGAVRFHISEYGLNYVTLISSSSFTLERYNPTYGTNYIKFNNTDTNTAYGYYTFNVRVSGMGGFSYVSDYLTTRVR